MHMQGNSFLHRAGWCGVLAGVLIAGRSALAQEIRTVVTEAVAGEGEEGQPPAGGEGVIEVVVEAPEGGQAEGQLEIKLEGVELNGTILAGGATPSEYWVGLMCEPVADPLRSQLKLGDKPAIVVMQVVPESPAAKAGVQNYDVILSVGDKPIANGVDLVKIVDEAKETDLTFNVIRGGGERTIVIKPAKRPESPPIQVEGGPKPGGRLMRFFNRAVPGDGERRTLRFAQPGAVFGFSATHELPEGTTVSIVKSGKEPAKIGVKKGDQSWEVTEDKLDDLPEDVRALVKPMLGGAHGFRFGQGLTVSPGAPGEPADVLVPGAPADVEIIEGLPGERHAIVRRWLPRAAYPGAESQEKLEKRIAELSEQIALLRQAIEGLEKK